MHRVVAGLRRHVGHRGSALLFFALLDLVYCQALLFPSTDARRSEALRFIAEIAPLWVWALIWAGVGLVCLAQAFGRRDRVAFTAAIGIKVLWGLVMLGGWLLAGLERGYVAAAVWLAMGAFVAIIASWPEPPTGWKERAWTQPSA